MPAQEQNLDDFVEDRHRTPMCCKVYLAMLLQKVFRSDLSLLMPFQLEINETMQSHVFRDKFDFASG